MEKDQLITLTADIVAAHVANNFVAISDVPNLVQQVHSALAGLDKPAEEPLQKREPAVSVRASVKPDYLVCMVCGAKQKTLKRHIQRAHDLSPEEYREEFGLPRDYRMVAPSYSERRSQMAKDIGLGQKGRSRKAGGASQGRGRGKRKSGASAGDTEE